jgi:hypothetical protein
MDDGGAADLGATPGFQRSTPSQTCVNSSRRACVVSRCRSQCVVIGSPFTYSMAKYGRPSGVVPPSNTVAIAGWSMRASACRSASNRATTWTVSMPVLMTFRATFRRIGAICSASQTSPIPPSAIL